jgi:hypothetical protein
MAKQATNVVEIKRGPGRPKMSPHQKRAKKGWKTRWANLLANGLIDADGNPTKKEVKKRRQQALRSWKTRRAAAAA